MDIVRIDMHEERERRGLEAIERFGALFVVVGLFELVCLEEKLEEMKRRTARLEEELRKREANAEEVIKARAEGLIRGERPEPGKRPPKAGK